MLHSRETYWVRIVRSGGDNQTSERFNASKSSLTEKLSNGYKYAWDIVLQLWKDFGLKHFKNTCMMQRGTCRVLWGKIVPKENFQIYHCFTFINTSFKNSESTYRFAGGFG